MKKKQTQNAEVQSDEELAKAFSNKKRWNNYYLFPIVIGVVTVGMLLFLILGGFFRFDSSASDASDDEMTLVKEYSFAEGSLPSGVSYIAASSESERFAETDPVCLAFEKINSGLLLSSFSYDGKLSVSLSIDSLSHSGAVAMSDETINYSVSFYDDQSEEVDVQNFVDVSLGNNKISSLRSDISSIVIKYINPIKMSITTSGYANLASISLYGVK